MRTSSSSVVLGLVLAAIIGGCSGSDDAAPNNSTGGAVAVGGGGNTGGAAQAGGAVNAGGTRANGGGTSTSVIAQACASDCDILSQANLTCVPSGCMESCVARYNSPAASASCQAAYLSLLQCGATQPAANWSCYQLVIPAPTKGCDTQIAALASQDLTCLVALAAGH